jgi:hypothetical protein
MHGPITAAQDAISRRQPYYCSACCLPELVAQESSPLEKIFTSLAANGLPSYLAENERPFLLNRQRLIIFSRCGKVASAAGKIARECRVSAA